MNWSPVCSKSVPCLALAIFFGPAHIVSNAQSSTPAPVPYASVSQLNAVLGPLEQTAQSTLGDLEKLRIDRWKTDSGTKRDTQNNVQSLQRNLQSALPEIIGQLRGSPEDLSATFKLYRNLDALYDVFSSVVESTGAFASKDDFQALSNDLSSFERSRRLLGERMENLTTSKEAELDRLRTQVKALAAAPPVPPKKVVVDDTEPVKKPPAKKKAQPKAPPKTSPPAAPPPASQPPQ
jgi:hypothetical protein